MTEHQLQSIEKLLGIVARLRHPEKGCPWDLRQTHQSLKPYMLEEAYEAVEAIDRIEADAHPDALREELGDVLLQVLLHSQLAKDAGTFDFAAVCDGIAEKLVRRHPHVFSPDDAAAVLNADQVVGQWERIKNAEKAALAIEKDNDASPGTLSGVLSGVSKGQPALRRALDTSKKAVKVGFEWPHLESLWECVMSEYAEFRAEIEALEPGKDVDPERFARLEAEMGDILFASVNLARHFKIDPEVALTRATAKFTHRFETMERLLLKDMPPGQSLPERMADLDFEAWDLLWREAKRLST